MRCKKLVLSALAVLGSFGLMSQVRAPSSAVFVQPVVVGLGYETTLHLSNAAGTAGNLSVVLRVGTASYGPYPVALGPRRALSVSLKDLFPNVPTTAPTSIGEAAMGALEILSDLPEDTLLASAETRGDWFSWQARATGAPTAPASGCATALASAAHPLWVSLFNPSTQSATAVLEGTWVVAGSGDATTLSPLPVELQPGESRLVPITPLQSRGLAAFEAQIRGLNAMPPPAATLLSLNPATGGATTSAFAEPDSRANHWILPYWTLSPGWKAYLVMPFSAQASVARISYRPAGSPLLHDLTLALPANDSQTLVDLAALLPGRSGTYEGMVAVQMTGPAGTWPPAVILANPDGGATRVPLQPMDAYPPVAAGSLMSAPLSLAESPELTVGLYNAGSEDVSVSLRVRGLGVGSDPGEASFTAIARDVSVLPKRTWTTVAFSDLLGQYGPYGSAVVELLQDGSSGTVFSSALSIGSNGLVHQSLTALPLAALPTFAHPFAIAGPSPIEISPGTAKRLGALVFDPATGRSLCPMAWRTRSSAGAPVPQVSIDASGLLSAETSAAGSSGFVVVPMMLPIDPGGDDFGDEVPDAGEGIYYGAGPMPDPQSIVPHFGQLAGGDVVDIAGTGFDPAGIEVKFRRTNPSTGAICNNKTQANCVSTCTTTMRTDTVGNITHIDSANIHMGPDASWPNGGTNASCRANKYGSARVVVKNLATGNKRGISYATGGFRYGWPEPTVSGVSPTSGPVTGGTTLTLSGGNFADDSRTKVFIGGIQAEVQSRGNCVDGLCQSITAITGTTGRGCTHPDGTVGPANVKVKNPDFNETSGYGVGTLSNGFTYTESPPPLLGAINPGGGRSSGGTPVTLTGTNLMRISQVTFGGALVTSQLECNENRTTLKLTSPKAQACGPVPVKITTVDGQVSNTLSFNYTVTPPCCPSPAQVNTDCNSGGTGTKQVTLTFNKGPACENFHVYQGEIAISGTSGCGVPAERYITLKSLDSVVSNNGTGTVTMTFNLPPPCTTPPPCVAPCVWGPGCYPFDPNVTVPIHAADGGTYNLGFTVHITN